MTEKNTPVAVVVLAAGAGTRMKSATQKTLHSIGGRTLLAHSLHAADSIAPDRVVAVIGHGRDQVGPAAEAIAGELSAPPSRRNNWAPGTPYSAV